MIAGQIISILFEAFMFGSIGFIIILLAEGLADWWRERK